MNGSEKEMSEHDHMKSGAIDLTKIPTPHKLHVLLRGLICLRLSVKKQTAELHIPQVNMHGGHIYRVGTYGNLRTMPIGHEYRLEGVQPGDLGKVPDMPKKFAALSMQYDIEPSDKCGFRPHGTHATVTLPWPNSIKSLRHRRSGTGSNPLFTYGKKGALNPALGYLTYLTYNLQWTDRPALYRRDEVLWYSEALQPHTTLHFFADPPMALGPKEFGAHVAAAYGSFNSQIFDPAFSLKEGSDRPSWKIPAPSADIPIWEQFDLTDTIVVNADSSIHPPQGEGDVGNCIPIVVID